MIASAKEQLSVSGNQHLLLTAQQGQFPWLSKFSQENKISTLSRRCVLLKLESLRSWGGFLRPTSPWSTLPRQVDGTHLTWAPGVTRRYLQAAFALGWGTRSFSTQGQNRKLLQGVRAVQLYQPCVGTSLLPLQEKGQIKQQTSVKQGSFLLKCKHVLHSIRD